MTQSLAAILYSNPSLKLERIQYVAEIVELQKADDYKGMRELIEAHKHYINHRNQLNSKEINHQHALRTLDWLSYMADLLLQGKNIEQAEETVMIERKQSPQHLWPAGPARKFYHTAAEYIPPFGILGFETILDNSVYSMPLNYSEAGERVLLLMGKCTLSEDHAIEFVKNKVIELEEIIKVVAAKGLERSPTISTGSTIKLDGMTKLENALITLPRDTKNKLTEGYEDCIKILRKYIEIPKEPVDYLSVKLGVVPKNIIDGTVPEGRDSYGYDIALKNFSIQTESPIWRAIIPFDQLNDQKPTARLDYVSGEKAWFVHQAVADVYSFFSDQKHFSRLTANQNLIPEDLLLKPVLALNSDQNNQSQN